MMEEPTYLWIYGIGDFKGSKIAYSDSYLTEAEAESKRRELGYFYKLPLKSDFLEKTRSFSKKDLQTLFYFIYHLPDDIIPPYPYADEDGVHLLWDGEEPLLFTIDDPFLYVVRRATLPNPEYWDNILFREEGIPDHILNLIPRVDNDGV